MAILWFVYQRVSHIACTTGCIPVHSTLVAVLVSLLPLSPQATDLTKHLDKTKGGAGRLGRYKVSKIMGLPSGYVKITMENGPVEIVDFPIQHGDVP